MVKLIGECNDDVDYNNYDDDDYEDDEHLNWNDISLVSRHACVGLLVKISMTSKRNLDTRMEP